MQRKAWENIWLSLAPSRGSAQHLVNHVIWERAHYSLMNDQSWRETREDSVSVFFFVFLAALEDSELSDRVEEKIEVAAASAVHCRVCWAFSASMANGYYEQSAARHEKLF